MSQCECQHKKTNTQVETLPVGNGMNSLVVAWY